VASDAFIRGVDILNPLFYRPVFLGDYYGNGAFKDDQDPLLYWGLPNVWEGGVVKCCVLKHARDPRWLFDPDQKKYVDPRERGLPDLQ